MSMVNVNHTAPVGVAGAMFGRRVILTSEPEITDANVAKEVEQAYITHLINRGEIEYLWKYYKGNQPSLYRVREIRNDLTQHVVENRANEIVSFKVGYQVGKPIEYVSVSGDEAVSDSVAKLNDAMRVIGKATKDKELVEWEFVAGIGYRMVTVNNDPMVRSPFQLYTLDPRNTFVIRSNDFTHRPLAGVNYVQNPDGNTIFSVYTPTAFYTMVKGTNTVTKAANQFGRIPIIEYPANTARLGAFETVLTMLDAINSFDSARLEAVEQFVQSLLVLYNCQLDDGVTADSIRQAGMILLKSIGNETGGRADIKNLSEQLDQSQNQTLKSDLYQSVLQIVGVPSLNMNGAADSSNNGAVVLRNGWQGAETRAQDFETAFKLPEKEMLTVVSVICNELPSSQISFDPADIEPAFTRRNYEDILSKSQTLVTMLQNDKIHPKKAYEASGMFTDTEEAYQLGLEWFEAQQKRQQEMVNAVGQQVSENRTWGSARAGGDDE